MLAIPLVPIVTNFFQPQHNSSSFHYVGKYDSKQMFCITIMNSLGFIKWYIVNNNLLHINDFLLRICVRSTTAYANSLNICVINNVFELNQKHIFRKYQIPRNSFVWIVRRSC